MNSKIIILMFLVSLLVGSCNNDKQSSSKETYTCPMHPQIIKNEPGNCPICGMTLVKKEMNLHIEEKDASLAILLKPTDEYVISSVPTVSMEHKYMPISINALGSVAYDTKQIGSISAWISGRIEKLYVRSLFQKVSKGQRIMDIYSPEILTAQENLLMLLNNDSSNKMMIESAKQKLLLLGMSFQQLQRVINKRKPDFTISVFSNYSGYIKNADRGIQGNTLRPMEELTPQTAELSIKEGMYVKKGETVFKVYNPSNAWVILNIYPQDIDMVKVGQLVNIVPEVTKDKVIQAKINFIEPFYQEGVKTITARVYFDNNTYKLPIGSQVEATIIGTSKTADWLPVSSVVSLGLDKVVFAKYDNAFKAKKLKLGLQTGNWVQVIDGLKVEDQVAENAQYLMDSESFIKINN